MASETVFSSGDAEEYSRSGVYGNNFGEVRPVKRPEGACEEIPQ